MEVEAMTDLERRILARCLFGFSERCAYPPPPEGVGLWDDKGTLTYVWDKKPEDTHGPSYRIEFYAWLDQTRSNAPKYDVLIEHVPYVGF